MVERSGHAPLSFAQQRLWFLDQLEPDGLQYLVPWAWRLSGDLDVPALTLALAQVVQRHEVLRTAFGTVEGEPVLLVEDSPMVEIPVTDLDDRTVDDWVTELMRRPFDLATVPLWRVQLLRLSANDHVLIFVWHHVVIDAWSANILLSELSGCYQAMLTGTDPDLPLLKTQYSDFARGQRERMRGAVLDEQLAYWREKLAGVPNLDLPADRPRPRIRSVDGASVTFSVPRQLVDGLRELGRANRVTLFMTLLAGFQVLLGRYAGLDDVAVGTPLANRNRAETEPLIGFFLNTLVLRTDLSGDPTFRELLKRVREVTLNAYDHEDLPFERMVEDLRPARDLSRTPLFQVMFLVNNVEPVPWDLPSVDAEEYPLAVGQSKFDLTAAFVHSADGMAGFLRYSTALFDRDRMERMAGHLLTLLAAVQVDPDVRLSRLPIITEGERQQVAKQWNTTTVPAGRSCGVHELVEAQVIAQPNAIALLPHDGRALTYAELNGRANQIAHHLRGLGIGPDSLVGVCMRRSTMSIAALLGVLKAGAAYLPVDPADPPARLRALLEGSRLVLTDQADMALLADFGDRLVILDEAGTRAVLASLSSDNPGIAVHPDNLAYAVHTSGSTGQPKRVLTTHNAVVSHLLFLRGEYQLGPADTTMTIGGAGFDATAREIFGALTSGARLVVPSPSVGRDPAEIMRILRTDAITVILSVVPSVLYELATQPVRDEELSAIRLVLSAGERLRAGRLGGVGWLAGRVVNQFGPTETTMTSTRIQVAAEESSVYEVGRPIANTRVYVLDAAMAPCPPGIPGELFIGGTGVARGYDRQPALTAVRFVPDPFSYGGRLYRTGDVCRWSADGVLEFLGRADHQFKVRGIRVEPAEIETHILAFGQVSDTVVVVRDNAVGDQRLVGYVVADQRDGSVVPELRGWLAETLPRYMVPGAFVVLPALPRLPNGKVDRGALPEPGSSRPAAVSAYVAPRSPTEEIVAGVWCEVLGIDRVGAFDDFFDLGGHSLLASRVVSKLAAVDVHVSLHAMFERPSVAAMAQSAADLTTSASLTRLSSSTSPLTLYCVHEGTGSVGGYLELARTLAADCAVVGVEFDETWLNSPGGLPIGAMAGNYVERLLNRQPHGPFAICGWSLGGLLAYEMARQLRQGSHDVAAVILVDTPVPNPRSAAQRQIDKVLDEFADFTLGDDRINTRFADLGLDEDVLLLDDHDIHNLLRRKFFLQTAKRAYRPERADVPLTVLNAVDSEWDPADFEAWRALAPRTRIIKAPGDHHSLMSSPDLHTVVAAIREGLPRLSQ